MSVYRTKVVIISALALLLTGSSGGSEGAALIPASGAEAAWQQEAGILDSDIAFYSARVARDPQGALDRARLGALYLQRARQTGSPADLERAEQIARESFGVRQRKNGLALHVLASSLLAQHRYQEALDNVRILVADDSTELGYLSLQGEIEVELGLYEAADSSFARLQGWSWKLSIAPRLARWAEIRGKPDQAHRILSAARDEARRQPNIPLEQLAWYQLRLGDLALRQGHGGQARSEYAKGLELAPGDHRLLAAMARLEFLSGDLKVAADFGERAIALVPDPATLGLLADVYAALGDSAAAGDSYRAMERMVLRQPGLYHRAWSLFLLDHGMQLEPVLRNVEAEITVRHDVYAYDLMAWALYRNGRYAEARTWIGPALALGTRDAQLFFHLGMIEDALGHRDAARRAMETALDINPLLEPWQRVQAERIAHV
jgi:tetratricopeptide (TPR) repeat protein